METAARAAFRAPLSPIARAANGARVFLSRRSEHTLASERAAESPGHGTTSTGTSAFAVRFSANPGLAPFPREDAESATMTRRPPAACHAEIIFSARGLERSRGLAAWVMPKRFKISTAASKVLRDCLSGATSQISEEEAACELLREFTGKHPNKMTPRKVKAYKHAQVSDGKRSYAYGQRYCQMVQ